jgi:uncharacterized protein
MIVVSDTSAITALLQIGRAALLQDLYGEVFIPEAVQSELTQTHSSLPPFLHSATVADSAQVKRLQSELDLGEAEAIVLAKELRADLLLMDDFKGRRAASREGVPFIGLLGVLLQAKQGGRIASLRELIQELELKAGFRLSAEVKSIALRKAGEM